jgi:hypothetical protein
VAGWDDLVSYVRVRYEVMRQAESELWFNLPTTGDRTQLVVVRRVTGTDGEPWAQIASPICKVDDADLDELLAARGGVGRRRAGRDGRGARCSATRCRSTRCGVRLRPVVPPRRRHRGPPRGARHGRDVH